MKIEECKSCRAAIVWAKNPKTDRWVPFDAKPKTGFILHEGEDNVNRLESQAIYTPHHATCPHSEQWHGRKDLA